ncbi:hypothetical protein SSCG_03863 [Streptomyces clavuligerus]|nr:hypothetical protein SSCG_03863 [Streptomyces clavuligerus]
MPDGPLPVGGAPSPGSVGRPGAMYPSHQTHGPSASAPGSNLPYCSGMTKQPGASPSRRGDARPLPVGGSPGPLP